MLTRQLLNRGIAALASSAVWMMLVSGELQSAAFAQQAQADKIPTAGVVLGWELNMGRNYSQKMEREMQNRPQALDDPKVIYFENAENAPATQEDFLLHTPVK